MIDIIIKNIIEQYMKDNPEQKKITKKEVQGILKAFENTIINQMTTEIKNASKKTTKIKVCTLGSLGSFIISYRNERKLNLPSKSGANVAPAAWVASLKPSKHLKDSLKINTGKK